MSGLRSIHAPVAKAAQVMLMGATKDMSMGNGAADLSGMASLKVTPLTASVQDERVEFCAWTADPTNTNAVLAS